MRGNYFWTGGGGQDRDRQNRERETEVYAESFCPENKRSPKKRFSTDFGEFSCPKHSSRHSLRREGGKSRPGGPKYLQGAAAPLLPAPMCNCNYNFLPFFIYNYFKPFVQFSTKVLRNINIIWKQFYSRHLRYSVIILQLNRRANIAGGRVAKVWGSKI